MLNKVKNYFNADAPKPVVHDSETLEGEWSFQGYFPQTCKVRPSCYTERMGLTLDKD